MEGIKFLIGDKILSENYLQHADHFSRILQIRELNKEQNIIMIVEAIFTSS